MAELEQERARQVLRSHGDDRRRLQASLRYVQGDLRQAIRDGATAGLTRAEMADLTGLSRAWVGRVLAPPKKRRKK